MKIYRIILGVLILGIISALIYLMFDKQKLIINNKNLKKEIENLNEQLNEKNNIKENINEEIKNCTYTKTYYFIDYLDFIGTVPTDKYIIVDKFQTQEPEIIKYNSSNFDIELEKNAYYEITFSSVISDGKEFKKMVTNIVKTDKIGFEQIQQNCEV